MYQGRSIIRKERSLVESPKRKSLKYPKRYQTIKILGEGSYGVVKEAVHIPTQVKVAIKIIDKKNIIKPHQQQRVRREIQLQSQASSNSIVQLYEGWETPEFFYIVLENMEGGSLSELIENNGAIPEDQARNLFRQVLDGVDHLHKLGIAHRDLKTANILLSRCKTVAKLADFGLSNSFGETKRLSTKCGSPSYVPPELLSEDSYNASSSDIWSLGITLYAMLSSSLPFTGLTRKELYKAIKSVSLKLPMSISLSARDLLSKLLHKDPSSRITLEEARNHPWLSPLPSPTSSMSNLRPGSPSSDMPSFYPKPLIGLAAEIEGCRSSKIRTAIKSGISSPLLTT